MQNDQQSLDSLKEIQAAISEVDHKRMEEGLSKDEVKLLEISSVALRDAERLLIAKLQKEIIADLEQKVLSVQKLSRSIRAKVTRMNNAAKSLDKVDNVIKGVVKILGKIFSVGIDKGGMLCYNLRMN